MNRIHISTSSSKRAQREISRDEYTKVHHSTIPHGELGLQVLSELEEELKQDGVRYEKRSDDRETRIYVFLLSEQIDWSPSSLRTSFLRNES